MTNPAVWKKVGIDVQTALATALTITGITKASPAVVAYTGTDPVDGDYILLEVTGMQMVDNMVVRAKNVSAVGNTFECEGLDSTLFDTFLTGTAKVITFGASMTTARDITPSGGDPKYTDITTVHDEIDIQMPVGFNPVRFGSSSIFDTSDAALLALRAASRALTPLAIKFRFANGSKIAFNSYISAPLIPGGSAGGVVETPISFDAIGLPSVWST